MVVRKILEQTLSAGSTSVIFTDAEIPNSLLRVFSSKADIIPVSRTISGTSLTVTYEPQTSNIDVAVEIVKAGLDIVDNLTSTDADKALSAKQGKLLNDAIEGVSENLSDLANTVANLDIPDNITDLDDVTVSDIQSGQVLSWNGIKFVNTTPSADAGDVYSSTETKIGTWLGNDLYRKVIDLGSEIQITETTWYISDIDTTTPNINEIKNAFGTSGKTFYPLIGGVNASGKVQFLGVREGHGAYVRYICIEYTKTV